MHKAVEGLVKKALAQGKGIAKALCYEFLVQGDQASGMQARTDKALGIDCRAAKNVSAIVRDRNLASGFKVRKWSGLYVHLVGKDPQMSHVQAAFLAFFQAQLLTVCHSFVSLFLRPEAICPGHRFFLFGL